VFSKLRSAGSSAVRVGLSIGPEAVAMAAVRRQPAGRPVLEHCSWQPRDPAQPLDQSIRALLQANGLARTAISVVAQPSEYQLVLIEAPDVLPAELRAAVRWRLRDAIDFHIDDAVVDVFELPAQSRRAQARMMYAVAARRAAIAAHVAALSEARGFNVIDVPELCLRNLAGLLEEEKQGVALLQVTANSGQVVLARQGVLYLARHMELQQVLAVAEEDERLDASIVALELQRSLDYESHYDQPPINHVAIAPGDARAAALVADLSRESSLQVRLFDLNHLLEVATPVETGLQARCLLAVGAALRSETATL
jgi:MSHA biogenesis protein MshI